MGRTSLSKYANSADRAALARARRRSPSARFPCIEIVTELQNSGIRPAPVPRAGQMAPNI